MKLLSDISLFGCLAIMAVLCGLGWLVEKVIELGCLVVQGWREIRKLSVLLAMGTLAAQAGEWLHYDAARRVPWANAPLTYTRCDYDWWVENTGQPSDLYKDGIYQESEVGDFDLDLPSAWQIVRHDSPVIPVAVVDYNTIHGLAVVSLVQLVAPDSEVTLFPVSRYYADVVSTAIVSAVDAGQRIVVMSFGYGTPEPLVKDALIYARTHGVVVVCALPNQPQDCDAVPDYPYSWKLANVLGVNSLDRQGNHYWSGHGTAAVGAPGRNIIGTDYYSSGTSYATPIVAGCIALLMQQVPYEMPRYYVNRARDTATPAGLTRRINPVGMVQ